MKTAFYSFEQNQRYYIVSSANLHGRWSAAGGARRRRICLLWRVDIHILFSWGSSETEGRMDYILLRTRLYHASRSQHRGLSECQRTTSWRASWSQTTTASMEIRDTKCRPVRSQYSGMSVLLSDNKVQVSWPQFVGDVFTLTYNNFTLSLPRRSISNFSCSLTRNITSDGMLIAHSDVRWLYLYQFSLLQSLIHLGECNFWSWEWKVDLTVGTISCFPKLHLDWLYKKGYDVGYLFVSVFSVLFIISFLIYCLSSHSILLFLVNHETWWALCCCLFSMVTLRHYHKLSKLANFGLGFPLQEDNT